uniref:acyl-protein thioesterase 2-like n=1 Tax=Erigeron canadensis TaxID=72917 RepID=UPI001CB9D580|nr:acyl-protein thioesterase 2-like [Erigeron canadensis]
MSLGVPSLGSVGRTARRALQFGKTYVVKPKSKHLATIVWMHGLGDNGSSWAQLLETLPLPNIKWICPTSPTQPLTLFGGFPSNAWFDIGDLSETESHDIEGLDATAAHVLSLLSTEPADVKFGVGGFSMGAAAALYCASCFVHGKLGNGDAFSTHLDAVVGLSGWLPCANDLSNKVEGAEAASRASSLPILHCHGKVDDVVLFRYGDKSAEKLTSCGFRNFTFKVYDSLGHYTMPDEMEDVCSWLTSKLDLKSDK